MRCIRLGGQGVSMWTPPMLRSVAAPPKRKAIAGWTKGAAQRNRAFLMSVDPVALSRDLGYAVTLTLGATPISAQVWGDIIHRLLVTLRRLGVIRYHWVTEWTQKGRPHLHLTFFLKGREPVAPDDYALSIEATPDHFRAMKTRADGLWLFGPKPVFGKDCYTKIIGPGWRNKRIKDAIPPALWITDMVVADAVFLAWQRAADPLPCNAKAQHIERIESIHGWSAYVAKHCARGINHYQRLKTVLPPNWTSSGRLWGKGGDWPTRSETLTMDDASYFRLRRAIRKWLRAKAAYNAANAFGRKQELALRDLKHLKRAGPKQSSDAKQAKDPAKLSSVYGMSSFIPRDLADLLLIWAVDHPRAVLFDSETGEVYSYGPEADRAILGRF